MKQIYPLTFTLFFFSIIFLFLFSACADGTDTVDADIDPPVIETTSFSFSLNEGTIRGTSVTTLEATDSSEPITFAMSQPDDDVPFAIDSTSGAITTTGALDFENTASYSFEVTVTDAVNNATNVTLAIAIGDVNPDTIIVEDPSPPLSINENVASGSTVGTLVPTYNGDDSISSFLIIEQTPAQKFDIDDAGVITTTGNLDFEEEQSYTLNVEVSDGSFLVSKSITVDINNLDDQSPIVDANQMFSIDENIPTGSLVGNVLASDNIGVTMYSITAGNGSPAVFSIDSTTGVLTTAEAIDFETTASYTLTIELEDAAGNTGSGTVTVNINNIPNAEESIPKVMAGQTFSVNENKPVNTVFGRVIASDDVGVTGYSINAGDANGQFAIDNNGDITVAKNIDYETTMSFTLTIEVEDAASQIATEDITVTVNDIFDEFILNELLLSENLGYNGITIVNDTILVINENSSAGSGIDLMIFSYSLTTGVQNTSATLMPSIPTPYSISSIAFFNNRFWLLNLFSKINVINVDGSRDSASDVALTSSLSFSGILIMGNDFWFVGNNLDQTFVYTNGVRDTSKGFNLHADNKNSEGIAHYNNHFYVVDSIDDHIYVYANSDGTRNTSLEIDVTATIPADTIQMSDIAFHNNLFYVLDGNGDIVVDNPVDSNVIARGDDILKVYLFKTDGTMPNE